MLEHKVEAFLAVFKPYNGSKPTKEVDYFDKKKDMTGGCYDYFHVGHQISPGGFNQIKHVLSDKTAN